MEKVNMEVRKAIEVIFFGLPTLTVQLDKDSNCWYMDKEVLSTLTSGEKSIFQFVYKEQKVVSVTLGNLSESVKIFKEDDKYFLQVVSKTLTGCKGDFPYTPSEQVLDEALRSSWIAYLGLSKDISHPDDQREVLDSIHRIQSVLMKRVARRAHPEYFKRGD